VFVARRGGGPRSGVNECRAEEEKSKDVRNLKKNVEHLQRTARKGA